jgi:hypothetical protein
MAAADSTSPNPQAALVTSGTMQLGSNAMRLLERLKGVAEVQLPRERWQWLTCAPWNCVATFRLRAVVTPMRFRLSVERRAARSLCVG